MKRRSTEKHRRNERVAVYLTKPTRQMLEERQRQMAEKFGQLSLSAVAADVLDEALAGQ